MQFVRKSCALNAVTLPLWCPLCSPVNVRKSRVREIVYSHCGISTPLVFTLKSCQRAEIQLTEIRILSMQLP